MAAMASYRLTQRRDRRYNNFLIRLSMSNVVSSELWDFTCTDTVAPSNRTLASRGPASVGLRRGGNKEEEVFIPSPYL